MEQNDINKSDNTETLNKKQKRDNTFNIIIGVSTLLIAILGATFAYFSATASSRENDVYVKSAYVSISYIGGTQIKATNLIPSSERVAIKMFQKQVAAVGTKKDQIAYLDEDEYTNDKTRRCIDSLGREVCYVYQFSIKSDGVEGGETEISGGIKINKNQFDNLSYIVYEVDIEEEEGHEDEEGYEYVDKFGHMIVKENGYTPKSEFDQIDGNDDHIDMDPKFAIFEKEFSSLNSNDYLSMTYPIACLFGFSEEHDDPTKADSLDRCTKIHISNKKRHVYQVMIWLEETRSVQPEQGLEFQGTVNLEVPGGNSEYANGHITGKD